MLTISSKRYVGIMACETEGDPPFAERSYYRRLCVLGSKAGVKVFIFSPVRIDLDIDKVPGYTFSAEQHQWQKQLFPLPDLVYDRCFYNDKKTYILHQLYTRKLKARKPFQLLGHGLKGKWEVQQTLLRDPRFDPYLPRTEMVKSIKTVIAWIKKNREIFLKPRSGSHGKGALYIRRSDDGRYIVRGRDFSNAMLIKTFDQTSMLMLWISKFLTGRNYLLQQYLNLTTLNGEAFDIRSLVQKNSRGNWQLTGMAVRCSEPGSITANLHGGGHAEEVLPFLSDQFGKSKGEEIIHTLRALSKQIPPHLEQYHGRLVELGIDFGVDERGQVWILEVNSKPGRAVFTHLSDEQARICSISNPIQYAGYLLRSQLGG